MLSTFRSLRHRNYLLYFSGQLVSLVGTWMQTTVLSWLAYAITHESKWPALITAAQILPTFLLGPWGGHLADRWPKRPLIFWMQTAFLILALVLQIRHCIHVSVLSPRSSPDIAHSALWRPHHGGARTQQHRSQHWY